MTSPAIMPLGRAADRPALPLHLWRRSAPGLGKQALKLEADRAAATVPADPKRGTRLNILV